MSSFQTLFTKMEDHTLIITINRPDKLNALNQQVMKDLDAVMDRVYKFCLLYTSPSPRDS